MINKGGKIYLAGTHFPWTMQKGYDWNYIRAEMYLSIVLKRDIVIFDVLHPDNVKLIAQLNDLLSDV